ncbi:MAG: thioredoxin domain-containing protein [Candidatus Magasanikbacteria bacterium]|jgi:protein-disulfide isomerase|nr:thioredoxin domain-containing protein [Candidatus Magasanikbacteria bacterium]MBT4221431.1 thioredoxin domain-containing protein [Candidatus Magasanikbacteria bacterium]MBT4350721.1 thioredoxin domain-containing protein [Candidatus Magasanikbacteria bacterium]MBT4541603.1 thioredoxin domain-containing protein [Candidatus Magasanikbacteria bacterium]MBT6252954.1 thioredoxin domain-containing protein [Candidatus Magasanikbacteria bacterium]
MEKNSQHFGFTLSPVQTFLAGIGIGVLILCTIGFFILLGIVLKGGVDVSSSGSNGNDVVAVRDTAPTPTPAPSARVVPPVAADDYIRGNEDAPITIVEYSDLDCPYCGRFHETPKEVIAQNNNVKWVYRNWPLESIHPDARRKANGAECAGDQGKYWEFIDAVFVANAAGGANTDTIAAQLGLNVSTFNSCIAQGEFDSKVQKHADQALAAGCRGTPCSFILKDGDAPIPLDGVVPTASVLQLIAPLL